MMPKSRIDADWVPPVLPELKVIEREGRWLCINPRVPAWIVTKRPGALLLQMIDGASTVGDYQRLLAAHGIPSSGIPDFFQSAAAAKLFETPGMAAAGSWKGREIKAIYLHLTNRCNLQCSYCYRESSPHLPILHDSRRFSAMLEYLKPYASPRMEITFSGGEPLMHPGFREVVETSTRLGYGNSLLTNATRITESLADFIHDHFLRVKISLDGPNEEIHSQTRGKGNFARVVKGIEKLAVRGTRLVVQVTLSKSAIPHVDKIREVLPDSPNLRVIYTPLFPMGRGTAMADDAPGNGDFYEFSTGHEWGSRYLPGRPIRGCHAGAASLSIADNGDVYPCHLFHFDGFRLGNVFHDPFEQIFFGDRARSYVEQMDVEHNNPTCRECEVRLLCGGGCHGNTLYSIGDFRGPDSCCEFLKRTILDGLFGHNALKEDRGLQTSL
jgi:radical SAM protein with 4Fe4S-binding SPASM domain